MTRPRHLALPFLVYASLLPAEPQVTHRSLPIATFVSHPLPQRKPIFGGVGSAVGVNDLDNDGDIDWYHGGPTFAWQELAADNAGGVNIVDFARS